MSPIRKLVFSLALSMAGLSAGRAFGKSSNLTGTIIAYDPIYHALKHASFVENLEVTLADVGSRRGHQRLVKLVFQGFGDRQLSRDVLEGEQPFRVNAVRDKSCDEAAPRVLSEVESSFRGSGTFLLNEAHRSISLGAVGNLECYKVTVPTTHH